MTYQELDAMAWQIYYISGYTIREIRDKLAAGYTLEPPEKPKYDELYMLARVEDDVK